MKKLVLLLLMFVSLITYSQPPEAIFVAQELFVGTAEYTYDETTGFEKTWNWDERVEVHIPIAIKDNHVIMKNSGNMNIEITKIYESMVFEDDDGDTYTTYIFDGIDQDNKQYQCYFRTWHNHLLVEFTMYLNDFGATYKGYMQKRE